MTDRMFVLSRYPNARVDLIVEPRNTMEPRRFYQARTANIGNGSIIICNSSTRSGAWRKAKILIKQLTHERP